MRAVLESARISCPCLEEAGLGPGRRPPTLTAGTEEEATLFLPFDISLDDSCRTNSGILSHCPSERQRSISVSSREPDFFAVIFVTEIDSTGPLRHKK